MPSFERRTTYASLAALFVCASASCDSKDPSRETAATSSTVTVGPSATASAPSKTTATPSKHADAKAPRAALPFTDEQKKRQPSYAESLAKGRKATSLHKYDDAVAAFDVAVSLAVDGRALSERGYARFLAKDYDLALKDFDAASEMPTDESLFGQIWFNKGLTYQALGRGKDADLAFYRSNLGHPTKAAEQRVAGKSVCPVKVDRSRVAAHAYAGWAAWAKEAAKTLSGMTGVAYVAGESEATAAERLCPGCKGDGPWTVKLGDDGETFPRTWEVHVLARRDGKLWDFGAFGAGYEAPATGEPCWSIDGVDLGVGGGHSYVHASSSASLRVPMKVDPDTGDVVGDCPEGAPWEACRRLCFAYAATDSYVVLDLVHPARVLTLTDDARFPRTETVPPPEVAVTATASGFELKGAGCGDVAWADAKPAPR